MGYQIMEYAETDTLFEFPEDFSELAEALKKESEKHECVSDLKRIKAELNECAVLQKSSVLELVIEKGNECLERVHGFEELEGDDIFEIEEFENAIKSAKKKQTNLKMKAAIRFQRKPLKESKADKQKRQCLGDLKRIKDELNECMEMNNSDDLELMIEIGNECLERINGVGELEGNEIFEIEEFERIIRAAKKPNMNIKMKAAMRFNIGKKNPMRFK